MPADPGAPRWIRPWRKPPWPAPDNQAQSRSAPTAGTRPATRPLPDGQVGRARGVTAFERVSRWGSTGSLSGAPTQRDIFSCPRPSPRARARRFAMPRRRAARSTPRCSYTRARRRATPSRRRGATTRGSASPRGARRRPRAAACRRRARSLRSSFWLCCGRCRRSNRAPRPSSRPRSTSGVPARAPGATAASTSRTGTRSSSRT